MGFPNPDNYPEIEADRWEITGDRILVAWDEQMSTILDGKLLTPQNRRKQHYTGKVIKIGPLVQAAQPAQMMGSEEWLEPDLKVGDRVFFNQFSDFGKFYDPKYGRLALIEESRQQECFAVIPPRVQIGEGEADFDYSL